MTVEHSEEGPSLEGRAQMLSRNEGIFVGSPPPLSGSKAPLERSQQATGTWCTVRIVWLRVLERHHNQIITKDHIIPEEVQYTEYGIKERN